MVRRPRDLLAVLGAYVAIAVCLTIVVAMYEPVSVRGGSMEPALYSGDVVLVKRRVIPAVGEIALVREPGRGAVMHRVESIEPSGVLVLRGDANPVCDLNHVPVASVKGAAERVIPVGKWVSSWKTR